MLCITDQSHVSLKLHLRTEFGFNDILLGSQAFNLRTVLSENVFDGGNFYEQII